MSENRQMTWDELAKENSKLKQQLQDIKGRASEGRIGDIIKCSSASQMFIMKYSAEETDRVFEDIKEVSKAISEMIKGV